MAVTMTAYWSKMSVFVRDDPRQGHKLVMAYAAVVWLEVDGQSCDSKCCDMIH
jgi:hypothetical protein